MSWFRKVRLKIYKKKKVRKQKTPTNRHYVVRFKVKIDDINYPHIFDKEFNMVIPAKAAFFAKRKLKLNILKKIDVDINDVDKITYKEYLDYERDRERVKSETEGRKES